MKRRTIATRIPSFGLLLALVAHITGTNFSQAGFCAVGCGPPPIVAQENEPFVRVWLIGNHEGDRPLTVSYATADGTARAGLHYRAVQGQVTIAPGQDLPWIEVPLIDNGLVDGPKEFTVLFANPEGLQIESRLVRIEDNEMQTVLDPLFSLDLHGRQSFRGFLPGGRVLVQDPHGLQVLGLDGSLLASFDPRLGESSRLTFVRALPDGRILVELIRPDGTTGLLRFLDNGVLDLAYPVARFAELVGIQDGGKVYVQAAETNGVVQLRRFNEDGTEDLSFRSPASFSSPTCVADQTGRGLLALAGGQLLRFNADGTVDPTFISPDEVYDFLPCPDGSVLVLLGPERQICRLDQNGGPGLKFDPAFWQSSPFPYRGFSISEPVNGMVFFGLGGYGFRGSVARWNRDGRLQWELGLGDHTVGLGPGCCWGASSLFFEANGPDGVLMGGDFSSVDGYPRQGVARLLVHPPERDFRVLAPPECRWGEEAAKVRVVRTGPSTNTATVSFRTRDGTALAGRDYLPQSGTLTFNPLQVSAEVLVPLLATKARTQRLFLQIELTSPSPGYEVIPATPIQLLPELRVSMNPGGPRPDGSVAMAIHGAIPGRSYVVEKSTDLAAWEWAGEVLATNGLTTFQVPVPPQSRRFFRAFEYP
jgi:hypothetical protein